MKNKNNKPLSTIDKELAHKIKNFLFENIHTNYTDKELADKFNTKPFFIKSTFPKVFKGKSVAHIVREERLRIAAKRIKSGELVKEVFRDAGYNTMSAFDNAFKRIFKKSPALYIKKKTISTSKKSN